MPMSGCAVSPSPQRVSFFSIIDVWPSLSEQRRSLVLRIVKAIATADINLCLGVARYVELRAEQAAQRESDRVVRHRATEYTNRRAIKQSLRERRQP